MGWDKMKRRRGQACTRKQDTASHREGKQCLNARRPIRGKPPGKGLAVVRPSKVSKTGAERNEKGEKGFFLLGAALLFRTLSFFSANQNQGGKAEAVAVAIRRPQVVPPDDHRALVITPTRRHGCVARAWRVTKPCGSIVCTRQMAEVMSPLRRVAFRVVRLPNFGVMLSCTTPSMGKFCVWIRMLT